MKTKFRKFDRLQYLSSKKKRGEKRKRVLR
jgi:hypothetical protein